MPANRQAVAQQFVQVLGRQARPEELDYFTKFLNEGSIQPHEVGQALQGLPEYQDALMRKQGGEYENLLAAGDARILDRAGGQITAQLARQGRSGSSALESGLAQAAGGLAQQRQSALAQFYGRGMQNTAGLYQSGAQNALERGYGVRDELQNFYNAKEIANANRHAYEGYLNRANAMQRRRGVGSAIGAGVGALGGFFAGGPMGAMAGGSLGGSIGGGLG